LSSIFGSLDNVKVEILSLAYDSTKRIPYQQETPVAQHVTGHLQDMLNSTENDVLGVHERDRMGRYRFVFKSNATLDNLIREGYLVHVTHTRHPDTNAWVPLTTKEQYVIREISTIHPGSRWKALNMTEKQNGA
jgi:hypothetical protein